jgi:hypothetical protein
MAVGFVIFVLIYVIYAILISIYMNRLFKRLSFLNNPEVTSSEDFPGFTRQDYKNWSKLHFTLGAIFLFPIRMLLTFSLMGIGLMVLYLVSLLCCTFSYSKKQSIGFIRISNFIIIVFCRLLMFINGLFCIDYKTVTPKPYNIGYFDDVGEVRHANIIVNHTTWEDIFFFLAQPKNVGFISHSGVKKYPIVGQVAHIIQSIFVDRTDPDSKKKCFEDMKKRAENIKTDPKRKFFILLIFYLMKK